MDKKIIDYTVIQEINTEFLKERVIELITTMGWQPTGGLAISFAPNGKPIFCQALVLYSN